MNNRKLVSWLSKASPYDAVAAALEMEKAAAKSYLQMARESEAGAVRAKLRYLAEEEREHAKTVARLLKALAAPVKPLPLPAGMAEAGRIDQEFSTAKALRQALKNENNAEQLYLLCAEKCRSDVTAQIFKSLAGQEANHSRLLRAELDELQGAVSWRGIAGTPPAEDNFWG